MHSHRLVRLLLLGLTFIVMMGALPDRVMAANGSPNPDFNDAPTGDSPLTEEQREMRQETDVAPKPPGDWGDLRRLGYYHRARHALSFLGGYVGVTDDQPQFHGSLLYLFHDGAEVPYEAGVHVSTDNRGALSFSRRFIFSTERFRPYSRLGLSIRINPEDQFATLLRYKYYRIFGAVGFEQLFFRSVGFRFEIQTGASLSAIDLSADAGLVFSW